MVRARVQHRSARVTAASEMYVFQKSSNNTPRYLSHQGDKHDEVRVTTSLFLIGGGCFITAVNQLSQLAGCGWIRLASHGYRPGNSRNTGNPE